MIPAAKAPMAGLTLVAAPVKVATGADEADVAGAWT